MTGTATLGGFPGAAPWRPWCSRITATPPPPGASGTIHQRMRPLRLARSRTGPPVWVSSISTASGRRGVAIRAESRPQHDLCPAAENSGRRLPPQRRPGGRRDRLAAQTQGLPALQAIFHVLGEWRDPRSPSCREGMGGQVQGQVRRRLGCLSRARFRARQSEGLDTGRRATYPPA